VDGSLKITASLSLLAYAAGAAAMFAHGLRRRTRHKAAADR
jgi:hypothetical protein